MSSISRVKVLSVPGYRTVLPIHTFRKPNMVASSACSGNFSSQATWQEVRWDKKLCFKIKYCEIINFYWTFNFVYFLGRAIHELKIPRKYLFTLVILQIIWNPRIQVSTNMTNVIKSKKFKPTNLNDFTVWWRLQLFGS